MRTGFRSMAGCAMSRPSNQSLTKCEHSVSKLSRSTATIPSRSSMLPPLANQVDHCSLFVAPSQHLELNRWRVGINCTTYGSDRERSSPPVEVSTWLMRGCSHEQPKPRRRYVISATVLHG